MANALKRTVTTLPAQLWQSLTWDRGKELSESAQYTSIAFGNCCKEMGLRPFMGSVDDAYDNAMTESFFASLECELIVRRTWKTKTEACLAEFIWIESWYNLRRRHSGLW